MERSAGHRGHFWIGASLGVLIGAVAGAVIVNAEAGDADSYSTDAAKFYGIVGGAIGGLLVGGTIGALIKTERWEPL